MEFNKYIQPACIPESYDLPIEDMYVEVGRPAQSLGWGWYYNESDWWTLLLTDYKVNIYPRERCTKLIPNIYDTHEIICAG